MAGCWFKMPSSLDELNVVVHARSIYLEAEMNLMEDLTKELQNERDE
jgi:hypothetical protein